MLLPSDPQNYYETRNLVPRDMLDDVRKARVVITNFHAFKLREKLQAPEAHQADPPGPRRDAQHAPRPTARWSAASARS